jgi:hypothetical protein
MTVRDMLTEDEAKMKRCPQSFPAADALSPSGHVEHVPIEAHSISLGSGSMTSMGYARHTAPTHCIAAECMFWRWSHQDHNGTPTGFCGGATMPKYI